jgi:hypothetical protein
MSFHSVQTIQKANIARFGRGASIIRSASPLDDDQIRRAVPAVFAEDKHGSRSDRYTYIPTSEVLAGLRREGFAPFEVRQGGSRDEEKRGFTKHLIRLRRDGARAVGDSFREIILLNSHDGTSSYQLMSGMFRLVCSNGLVVADGFAQAIRIPHKGDIVGQVIDAAYTVIDQGAVIDNQVAEMRAIELKPAEQEAFAEAAAELRFEDGRSPIKPSQINAPRRRDDVGADLWRTFNRTQENLVRGDINYTHTNDAGMRSRRSTRPVNGIDGNVTLNKALWTLAAKMQEIKSAA